MTCCGIYCILNVTTQQCYVGSSRNIRSRWTAHRCRLRAGTHHSIRLQRAWNRDGESCFEFKILELIEEPEELTKREQHWMDSIRSYAGHGGYNSRPKAESNAGVVPSAEKRQKISAANKRTKTLTGGDREDFLCISRPSALY